MDICAETVPDTSGKWSEWQDLNLRPPRPERNARHLSPCNYDKDSPEILGTAQEHPAISVPYLCHGR